MLWRCHCAVMVGSYNVKMSLRRYAKRLGGVASIVIVQVSLWLFLRIVLIATFADDVRRPARIVTIVGRGLLFDVLAALTSVLPLIFVISVFRLRWLNHPWVRNAWLAVLYFLLSFNVFVGYFFFEDIRRAITTSPSTT